MEAGKVYQNVGKYFSYKKETERDDLWIQSEG